MKNEIIVFLRSVVYGAELLFIYDFIRSIQRVWNVRKILTVVTEMIFCIAAGIFLFVKVYEWNGGTLRWYIVVGVCGGMLAYFWSFSPYVVKIEVFSLKRLKMLISWVKIFVKKVISFVFKTLGMYYGEKCK